MSRSPDALASRLAQVRKRLVAAARRAGRAPEDVTLVAVTKGVGVAQVREALALGLRDLGENRVQEALPKIALLGAGPRWHLVGHLQRNKARHAAEAFTLIHSVDSLRLGETLARHAERLGREVRVLLQVNVAREPQKYGFASEEVVAAARAARGWTGVRVLGLMTIAPLAPDPEAVRPVFRALRALRDRVREVLPDAEHLSMGMTDDFEVAVEEGATRVRIGRALFGERPARPAGAGEAPTAGSTGEGRGEREV